MSYISKLVLPGGNIINNTIDKCGFDILPSTRIRLLNPFVINISDDGLPSPATTNASVSSIYPLNTLDQVTWTFRETDAVGAILGTITGTATDPIVPSGIFTGGTYESPIFDITFCGDVYVELSATDSAGNISNDNKTLVDYNISTIVFETTNVTLTNISVTADSIIDIDLGDGNHVFTSPINHTYIDGLPSHTVTIRACNVTVFTAFSNGLQTLTGLDSARNTLANLRCFSNNISALDVTNLINLTILYCFNNNISALNVTNLINLTELFCYANNIPILNVANLINLTKLLCFSNNISILDVTNLINLTDLRCYTNNISVLDVTNLSNLSRLECLNTNISILDVSNMTLLILLNITNTLLPTAQVDQIFSDMAPQVPNNGTLTTGGSTGALTGGVGNADYITLTGNGWTINGV